MSAIDIGPIRKVSPFIKLTRWSLLLAGIWWGNRRYNHHYKIEMEERAYNERMKPIWEAEKAALKAKANRDELLKLGKEVGIKPPPGF